MSIYGNTARLEDTSFNPELVETSFRNVRYIDAIDHLCRLKKIPATAIHIIQFLFTRLNSECIDAGTWPSVETIAHHIHRNPSTVYANMKFVKQFFDVTHRFRQRQKTSNLYTVKPDIWTHINNFLKFRDNKPSKPKPPETPFKSRPPIIQDEVIKDLENKTTEKNVHIDALKLTDKMIDTGQAIPRHLQNSEWKRFKKLNRDKQHWQCYWEKLWTRFCGCFDIAKAEKRTKPFNKPKLKIVPVFKPTVSNKSSKGKPNKLTDLLK